MNWDNKKIRSTCWTFTFIIMFVFSIWLNYYENDFVIIVTKYPDWIIQLIIILIGILQWGVYCCGIYFILMRISKKLFPKQFHRKDESHLPIDKI